ncbi:MAG: beta strand repeat-containing protein [Bacteroidia bacterium]
MKRILLFGLLVFATSQLILAQTAPTGTLRDSVQGKPAGSSAVPGDTIVYKLEVINNGTTNPDQVEVTMGLDGNLNFKAGSITSTPIALPQTVTTDEDVPLSISLGGDDIDGDDLTFTVLGGPSNGSLGTLVDGADPTRTSTAMYTPTFNYNGSDKIVFQVMDDDGNIDKDSVMITITPVNDCPVAVDDTLGVTDGGAVLNGNVLSANNTTADSDPEGDGISVSAVNGMAANVGVQITIGGGLLVTLNNNGTFNIDDNGAYASLAASGSALETFTYTVDDGSGSCSNMATVRVTITGANTPPTAVADVGATSQDVVLIKNAATGVLSNDTDPDAGDTKTVSAVNGVAANVGNSIALASGATITINADGSYTYDPKCVATGNEVITYTVKDAAGATSTNTLTINVSSAGNAVHVDNSAAAGGDGSLAAPYNTLALAEANSTAGQAIFVHYTGTNYTGGITLKNNQELIGEGEGLFCGTTAIVAAGTAPTIENATGSAIVLASGNTIKGIVAGNSSTNGCSIADGGAAVGTLTISNTSINNTVGGGFCVTNGGVLAVTLAAVTSTGSSGIGIDIQGATGMFTSNGGTITSKNGADGSTTSGIGVYLKNTTAISLNNMQLNDFQNYGIRGDNVTDFTLTNTTINGVNGTSTAMDEGSIRFTNLLGVATFTNNTVSGGIQDNIFVMNNTGTLNRMTVSGGTIGLNGTNGNDGILVEAEASSTVNVTVDNVTFSGARGDMFQANATGNAQMDVILQNSTLHNIHPNIVSGGGGITLSSGGATANNTVTYLMDNNSIRGADGNAITANFLSNAGSITGTISNNAIGLSGSAGTGSVTGSGISAGAEKNGAGGGILAHTVSILNNTILGVTGYVGIDVRANNGASAASRAEVYATINGNTVNELGGFAFAALALSAGGSAVSGDFSSMCSNVNGNTLNASGASAGGGNAIYVEQISSDARHNFPAYSGSGNGEFAACGAGTASAGLNTYMAGRTNTMTNGGFPLIAGGVDATVVCSVTGSGTTCP